MDATQISMLEQARMEIDMIQRVLSQDPKDLTPFEINKCASRAAAAAAELNKLSGYSNRNK